MVFIVFKKLECWFRTRTIHIALSTFLNSGRPRERTVVLRVNDLALIQRDCYRFTQILPHFLNFALPIAHLIAGGYLTESTCRFIRFFQVIKNILINFPPQHRSNDVFLCEAFVRVHLFLFQREIIFYSFIFFLFQFQTIGHRHHLLLVIVAATVISYVDVV